MTRDLELLTHLGRVLNLRTCRLPDRNDVPTVEDLMIEGLLKIRSKSKGLVRLRPNRAQGEYSRNCTRRNIVLKARELGMTTYIAARFLFMPLPSQEPPLYKWRTTRNQPRRFSRLSIASGRTCPKGCERALW